MKVRKILFVVLLFVGCASEQEKAPPAATSAEIKPIKPGTAYPKLNALKIGMSRQDVEKLLGEPDSVKETATELSYTWLLGDVAKTTAETDNLHNKKTSDDLGGIAVSAVGMVHPAAGLAARLGSAIYDSVDNQPEAKVKQQNRMPRKPLVVTVEFRDDKVYSIQKTRGDAMLPTGK